MACSVRHQTWLNDGMCFHKRQRDSTTMTGRPRRHLFSSTRDAANTGRVQNGYDALIAFINMTDPPFLAV
eukprot:scaffold263368_cov20-Prasinocladus_malaysianus.AAC.2